MTIPARGTFGYDFVLLGMVAENPLHNDGKDNSFVRYYETTVFQNVVDPLDQRVKEALRHNVVRAATQEQLDRVSGYRPDWPKEMVAEKDTILFFVSKNGEVFVSPEVKQAVRKAQVLKTNELSFEKLRAVAQVTLRQMNLDRQQEKDRGGYGY